MHHVLIENIFRKNIASRYMEGIYLPEMFKAATESLLTANHVAIVTGFVVKEAKAGETDGPPGALMMAKCLEKMGKKVTLITDAINEKIMEKGRNVLGLKAQLFIAHNHNMRDIVQRVLLEDQVTHLVAIERPSRAKDNHCYSMRGEVITEYVANTDLLFRSARDHDIVTVGIGDGGNEVGMACIQEYVHKYVPKGALICSNIEVDYLILGTVSNWVAYGVCAALSISQGIMLLHEASLEKKLIQEIVKVGAVDGVTKKHIASVDGIDISDNLKVLNDMRKLVFTFI